jgi:ADP-ribose pyrophosphatase YjhB (NUDIX family)
LLAVASASGAADTPRAGIIRGVHVTEEILAPVRARYGEPAVMRWKGEISSEEYALATYEPGRTHDVTLFVTNGDRLALIRKPSYPAGIWRTPGGGIHAGEDFELGAAREALEETGLAIELRRYLVVTDATFTSAGRTLDWSTHVFWATTADETPEPRDRTEIESARWGTAEELVGPIRRRILETGRALWRYRAALHDAALQALQAL